MFKQNTQIPKILPKSTNSLYHSRSTNHIANSSSFRKTLRVLYSNIECSVLYHSVSYGSYTDEFVIAYDVSPFLLQGLQGAQTILVLVLLLSFRKCLVAVKKPPVHGTMVPPHFT